MSDSQKEVRAMLSVVEKRQDMEVVVAELERSLQELEVNYRKVVSNLEVLRQRVEKDDLTKLLSRSSFFKRFRNLLSKAKPEDREVCVLMMDIDFFKLVNDTYGHQTGDMVLERVASLVQHCLRPQDFAGRYGGEEVIVAIEAKKADARRIAQNIRSVIESQKLLSRNNKEFRVSLSIGLASTKQSGFEMEVLISEADAALYRAKHNGRNQVVDAEELKPIELFSEQALAA